MLKEKEFVLFPRLKIGKYCVKVKAVFSVFKKKSHIDTIYKNTLVYMKTEDFKQHFPRIYTSLSLGPVVSNDANIKILLWDIRKRARLLCPLHFYFQGDEVLL